MRAKDGVILLNPHPAILYALEVVNLYWRHAFGRPPTLTAGRDGVHSEKSLHYGTPEDTRERAIDLRTNDLDGTQKAQARAGLIRLLGPLFDVVLEATHMHIEFDPKVEDLG